MARLFIFGNGYDSARLKGGTSYQKFKKYINDNYGRINSVYEDFLNVSPLTPSTIKGLCFDFPDDKLAIIEKSRKEFTTFILDKMIDELSNQYDMDYWQYFENALGKLQLNEEVERFKNYCKENKIRIPNSSYFYPDYPTYLISSVSSTINALFVEWVESISIDEIKDKKPYEIDVISQVLNTDIFITFNYTKILEKLFPELEGKIYHLHGIKDDKNSIVVGHRNLDVIFGENDDPLEDAIACLQKPVERIIEKNGELWKTIKNNFLNDINNEIYEFGWSCSEEDIEYIKNIISVIPNMENTTIYLNNFNDEAPEKLQKWENNGYKGKVVFYMENKKDINKYYI